MGHFIDLPVTPPGYPDALVIPYPPEKLPSVMRRRVAAYRRADDPIPPTALRPRGCGYLHQRADGNGCLYDEDIDHHRLPAPPVPVGRQGRDVLLLTAAHRAAVARERAARVLSGSPPADRGASPRRALDALDPNNPDTVSVSSALAEMLVIGATQTDPHWNNTACKLVCDPLVYGGSWSI